jgi:hypothetical protein
MQPVHAVAAKVSPFKYDFASGSAWQLKAGDWQPIKITYINGARRFLGGLSYFTGNLYTC